MPLNAPVTSATRAGPLLAMAMLPTSHTVSGSGVGCRPIFSLPSDLLVCIEAPALYRLKHGVTAAFEGTLGLLVVRRSGVHTGVQHATTSTSFAPAQVKQPLSFGHDWAS